MASNSKTGAIAALRRKLTDGSLITAIAEKGKEIAEEKYSLADYGTNQTNIVVSAEVISPTKARVTAKGDRISYLEYGTGYYAQGSYPADKLPSWWQYYYPSQFKKTKTYNGEEVYGWDNSVYGFCIGQKAGAQMFYTSEELKQQIPSILKQILR